MTNTKMKSPERKTYTNSNQGKEKDTVDSSEQCVTFDNSDTELAKWYYKVGVILL